MKRNSAQINHGAAEPNFRCGPCVCVAISHPCLSYKSQRPPSQTLHLDSKGFHSAPPEKTSSETAEHPDKSAVALKESALGCSQQRTCSSHADEASLKASGNEPSI